MTSGPRVALGVAALAVAALLGACGGGGSDDGEAATDARTTKTAGCPDDPGPTRNLPYSSVPGVFPRFLSLDVYPAAHGCPALVVVWVHGGGWRIGDKRNQLTDKLRLWGIPRFLLVERGTPERRGAAETFAGRLRDGGVEVTTVDANPLSHADVNSEIGRSGDTVITPPLTKFLTACFATTP
jgi:acetyl esterase/lipase